MGEWQPMETAPKDGTAVDVWVDDGEGGGHRITDAWFGEPSHTCIDSYCDSCPEDLGVEAWRDHWETMLAPVAWMPLPPPPTSGGK